MGTGILICGLNGVGKSTLGRALAQRLGYHFIDSEELYFDGAAGHDYAVQRTRREAEARLAERIAAHPDFVLASVRGDYGEALRSRICLVVQICAPRKLRLRRVRERSQQKFGARMLPGGDLHAREASFLEFVSARPEDTVDEWLKTIDLPVLRVDGARDVSANVEYIASHIARI